MAMETELRTKRIMAGVDAWTSYYRANIHRFVKDYLNISLRLFQKILIYMMDYSNYFCYIAARGWHWPRRIAICGQ